MWEWPWVFWGQAEGSSMAADQVLGKRNRGIEAGVLMILEDGDVGW